MGNTAADCPTGRGAASKMHADTVSTVLSTKKGASPMTENNWDRVPIDAQSIDAPLSKSAIFLVVTVAADPSALAQVCTVLDGLDDLVKTVGFRHLSGRLSCIVGIGSALWDRLHVDGRPQELKPFAPI